MREKNRFQVLLLLFGVFAAVSLIVRTVLLIKSLPNIDLSVILLAKVYGVGFFYDCVTYAYLAVPFAWYLVVVPDRVFRNTYHAVFFQALCFLAIFVLLFDAAAEHLFFDEFGTRFNFIAVDYLVYTREVIGNIRESYDLRSILGSVFLASAAIFLLLRKHLSPAFMPESGFGTRMRRGLVLSVVPLLAFAFVNLSYTNISDNAYANELAGNGIYDLFAAFRNNSLDYAKFYPTRDEGVMLARVRGLVREKNNRLATRDLHDVTRMITNSGPEKRLNVIVIVEESLSAEYVGAYGGPQGLTPNLDSLAGKSLVFTHLYATGTRTVRGLEAITLSVPPSPGTSIVKQPGNGALFSWGSVMRSKGYDTKFIYGGHGYFDNMNAFFSGNGFDIVDRSAFGSDEVVFSNVWGVSDEDLFRKVIREAGKSHVAGKPFFSMVMTTSNHRPFTYPEGRIDIPQGAGRNGGVKYADYAIGRLMEEARRQPWFHDTVFVIVADHCAGSAGKTELPVKRYEIPLFIYAPAHVAPGKIDRLASQIDVAPTVMGLLNFSYQTKFFGRDLLKVEAGRERAFISTYQKLGYITGDKLLVISPQKRLKAYTFDRTSGDVREIDPPDALVNDMLSYYQGADYLYKHRVKNGD